MTLSHLTLIGERINPGFASSKALLDKEDIKGLQELAVSQVQKGAQYLTINVGDKATRDPSFLVRLIEAVQDVVDVPLSFDYPHRSVQQICLKTYQPEKARGRKPIVNSVTELRLDMLDLLKFQPFRLVLEGSPFQDIENLRRLRLVVRGSDCYAGPTVSDRPKGPKDNSTWLPGRVNGIVYSTCREIQTHHGNRESHL